MGLAISEIVHSCDCWERDTYIHLIVLMPEEFLSMNRQNRHWGPQVGDSESDSTLPILTARLMWLPGDVGFFHFINL